MTLARAVATACLLAAGVADARMLNSAARPLVIRIEGHVGAPRPGDRRIAELTLRRDDRTIPFQVDEIWVLSGPAVGTDVLHEVEPYTPSMSVAGPREVLAKLDRLRPEDRVQVTGFFRSGQRLFSLSGVEPVKRR